jgi:hypothetical protein
MDSRVQLYRARAAEQFRRKRIFVSLVSDIVAAAGSGAQKNKTPPKRGLLRLEDSRLIIS